MVAIIQNILQRLCNLEAGGGRTFVDSTSNGLSGAQDNSNRNYTVSKGRYTPGSLLVFYGNFTMSAGHGIIETDPTTGVFTLLDTPQTDDVIIVQYAAI